MNPTVISRIVFLASLFLIELWGFTLKLTAEEKQIFQQLPEVAQATTEGHAETEKPQPSLEFNKGPTPQWIWGPNPDKKYWVSKEFDAPELTAASLKTSCDNQLTLFINGKRVTSSSEWQTPTEVDIQPFLQVGKNRIVAAIENQGSVSGFLVKIVMQDEQDKRSFVTSDKTWRASESKKAQAFVPLTVHGNLGMAPWGNVFAAASVTSSERENFRLLPGFQVENLFTVPRETLGSWVAITFDEQGRLIASDQGDKGLCRITPAPIGSALPTRVERLDVKISSAQGLLFAFNSLYISVNGGPGSGLYRTRDIDGDDQFDDVEKLFAFDGGGEHGPHALRLSPDGKSIYVIAGNHTDPPRDFSASRLPSNWSEDLLLPRQWDANGHARGKLAPGGWIAKTDPEGKTWELISSGYRNPYDMDFNVDGELFAYDADMEWDYGTPWYRPTRVVHAVSGSEFGWRSGTGKWPTYFVDSLPPLVNIGPGSPVGVAFGYGSKFPAKYQRALYCCDWTFGTMYAVHITPDGASYSGSKEEFVSRTPLPLTDVAIGKDGAMYFTVGGRGAQSELFRITYIGEDSTEPAVKSDQKYAQQRQIRRRLEAFQASVEAPQAAVTFAWQYLNSNDRHIRYAARVALEHQPVDLWRKRVFVEDDEVRLINASVALARQGSQADGDKLTDKLLEVSLEQVSPTSQLDWLRALQLILIRMEPSTEPTLARLMDRLDGFYPHEDENINRELSRLLIYLQSPNVAAKTLALMKKDTPAADRQMSDLLKRNPGYGKTIETMLANQPDLQQLHYAFALRNLKSGWTTEQRVEYFDWFNKARTWSGGASFQGFLKNIDIEAYDNATDTDRLAIEAFGARKPYVAPELPQPQGPGHEWSIAEVIELAGKSLRGRNFENGKKMYSATRCVLCHRFAGEGGATGPDLTQLAGRFNLKDLCESIMNPSKVISDQYRASIAVTEEGKIHTGRIVAESKKSITMLLDPEDATKIVTLEKAALDELTPSKTSIMPKDLLKTLNPTEVLDLLAYLLSRGDPGSSLFQP